MDLILLKAVERGETVVFNTPNPTERPMDLMTYLVKRCVAVPEDVFEIRDRQIFINGEQIANPPGMKFLYHVVTEYPLQQLQLNNLGLDGDDFWHSGFDKDKRTVYSMYLTDDQLNKISKAPYLISMENGSDSPVGFPLFPASMNNIWTLNHYGTLTVPHKEMSIPVNDMTMDLYGELIEKYERNKNVKINKGKLEIDGKEIDNYTFKQDYYFMMGDSRDNSIDSRYYGFVPESHIVGKPVMVLFSKNEFGEGLNKVRWDRIFSIID